MNKNEYNGLIIGIILIILGIFGESIFFIIFGGIFIFSFFQANKKSAKKVKNFFNKLNLNDINIKPNKKSMQTLNPKAGKKAQVYVSIVIVLIILLSISKFFWVIVPAGQTGVKSMFGKVQDTEFSSGFHLKNPFIRVTNMSIRTQDYTMSVTQGEGQRYGSDVISALTKEGLSVDLDITVLYHLEEEKASDIYRDVGLNYDEVVIRPQIRSVIREVIAQYEAKDIYSEKRQEAAKNILEKLQTNLQSRGVIIEDVLLRHVELPTNLANSIQEKLKAEQDAQRYDFLLEQERKEADRKRIEAEGQRDAQQIINQSLTQTYLHYLYIENLKDREGTIYVPTSPNTGVPLFRGL